MILSFVKSDIIFQVLKLPVILMLEGNSSYVAYIIISIAVLSFSIFFQVN